MLTLHTALAGAAPAPDLAAAALPDGVVWVDALTPTEAETAYLQRALGVAAPTLEQMSEIETSSRLYRVEDTLYLTLPLALREPDGLSRATPLAFILAPKALVTVRHERIKPCDMGLPANHGATPATGPVTAFVALAEAIVDHLADELEFLTAALERHSHSIFSHQLAPIEKRRRPTADDLRMAIVRLGQARSFSSHVEETLLGLTRMTPFVAAEDRNRIAPEASERLDRLARDVASLTAHENRLTEKIQFLLDASLGLIGVEQNDIFKILTIVSVIGIPPTFIASMYGMNFKNIGEYDWAWGYQWGLSLIVLSTLIPLFWFKWKRWW